jgi:regulator of protease activity HflC (stomatin/prohibitin superfamily)
VQDIPTVTGWVFFNPLTEQIIEFPTNVQNVIWTQSAHEGRAVDESITFSSEEGVNINSDIGLSFHIVPAQAPHLYLRFRQPDLMELAHGYVRNAIREAFNDVASRMPVQKIYGSGKHELVENVRASLNKVLVPDGFAIDQLTINGALRLPENVATAINRAMEATQLSIQAENRVRQVRAEAEQNIAQAQGLAEAARKKAQGDADAVLIRASADAKANEIIRLSASSTVLHWRALERWDGKLPMMQSGDKLPMLTFDVKELVGSDADRGKRLLQLLKESDVGARDKAKETAAEDKAAAAEKAAPSAPADRPVPAPAADKPAPAAPADKAAADKPAKP